MDIVYTLPHRIHRLLTGIQPDVLNQNSESVYREHLLVEMKNLINKIDVEAFNPDTFQIDYTKLKNSDMYQAYRELSTSLQNFDLQSLNSTGEKLAFWINLYNLLAVDAVIHYGVESSINEVNGVFYKAGYNIGGCFFGLHDIEQGILRANTGHPAVPGAQFASHDPRSKHIVPYLDPRIHFALVCAAESCPPINVYDAEKIDSQLDLATRNFINSSEVTIDLEKKQANLSKIFQWYAPDFGAKFSVTLGFGDATPILKWIADFRSNLEEQKILKNEADAFSIRFFDYNWSLNKAG